MTCRRLIFPMHLVDAVGGAISLLLDEQLWQKVGTETVEETVEYLDQMWLAMSEGCQVIGEVKTHTLQTIPDNWLPCDGAQYLRVDYPLLYAVIHPNFIVDADNFIVPDMRDRVVGGEGALSTMGQMGGTRQTTLALANMPEHNHQFLQFQQTALLEGAGVPYPLAVTAPTLPANTNSKGGNAPFSNLPPYSILGFAIVAG